MAAICENINKLRRKQGLSKMTWHGKLSLNIQLLPRLRVIL